MVNLNLKYNIIEKGKKICIIGTGGFAREVLCCLIDIFEHSNIKIEDLVCFLEKDEYCFESNIMGIDVVPQSKFDPELYNVVVAIGDPFIRKKVVESLPSETSFTTIIHPSAVISRWVEIGEGSIICAGTIITCNIKMGKHSQLNLHTTIGHDCRIGNYFTTAPAVNISGNCRIGNCVYFGTNSATKQGVKICDNTTIGMSGVVVKDINDEGIFIGNPIKKLDKSI